MDVGSRIAAVVLGAMLALAAGALSHAADRADEPLRPHTYTAPEGSLWVRWRTLAVRMEIERRQLTACRADSTACAAAAQRVMHIIEQARSQRGRDRLDLVQQAVHAALRWSTDQALNGGPEAWMTASQSFAAGSGRCIDFAIAKYSILRAAGMTSEELRIVILRVTSLAEHHAVLAARSADGWLVLDNRFATLRRDSELTDYVPLFTLSLDGVHQYGRPSPPGGFKIAEYAQRTSVSAGAGEIKER